jgi:hypothetical protein
MPFNGSGVFQRVRNWVADATAGIKIRADYHDAEDDGFANGLTNCITKDGQTVVTQNIPFNSKRITGLADPINPQDASTKAYADTKLATVGDGDMTIKKANPVLTLDSGVGGANIIVGKEDGKDRWWLILGNISPETGSDAGSDFYLIARHDTGTESFTALKATRATGLLTVCADPTAPLGVATKQYVDAADAAVTAAVTAAAAATYHPKTPQLFAGIPVTHFTAEGYWTSAVDEQKMLCMTGGTPVTISVNGAVHPVGTTISFLAYGNWFQINNTETMLWRNASGTPTTGNRQLQHYGVCTIHKFSGGLWVISGNGVT